MKKIYIQALISLYQVALRISQEASKSDHPSNRNELGFLVDKKRTNNWSIRATKDKGKEKLEEEKEPKKWKF